MNSGIALGLAGLAMLGASSIALAQDYEDGKLAMSAKEPFGEYLTDSAGRALYMFEEDKPGQSTCYEACAKVWPPFVASEAIEAEDVDKGLMACAIDPDALVGIIPFNMSNRVVNTLLRQRRAQVLCCPREAQRCQADNYHRLCSSHDDCLDWSCRINRNLTLLFAAIQHLTPQWDPAGRPFLPADSRTAARSLLHRQRRVSRGWEKKPQLPQNAIRTSPP
jgi:hypothetical protein